MEKFVRFTEIMQRAARMIGLCKNESMIPEVAETGDVVVKIY